MTDNLTPTGKPALLKLFLLNLCKSFWAGFFVVTIFVSAGCTKMPVASPPTSSPASSISTSIPSQVASRTPVVRESSTPLVEVSTIIPTALPSDDVSALIASQTLDAYVETQLATMEMPTFTPTACINSPCTTPTPYFTRTPTQTATPKYPDAFLHIAQPGPLSRVISPIRLSAKVHTQPGGIVRIELIGEDGRLIYRRVYREMNDNISYYSLNLEIDYEIPGVSEAARLQVSVDDAYLRPVAQTSVDLILLTMGDENLNLPDDGFEPIIIRQPVTWLTVKGGTLHVEGLVRPYNNNPLEVELLTQDGSLLASRTVDTPQMPLGVYRPLSFDLPYNVSQLREARLIISQEGDHIPGIVILNSISIWLAP
jgi:hypothetical protein